MQSWFTFEIDGETRRAEGEPVHLTLAAWLDRHGEGMDRRFRDADPWLGGAAVLMLDEDGKGRTVWRCVDSSNLLLPSIAGRRLWTVEGIQRLSSTNSHPALEAVRKRPWIDCGAAGRANVTTALFEGMYGSDPAGPADLTEHLDGCLSRTADYGAIREAAIEVFAHAARLRRDAEKRARVRGNEEALAQGKVDIHGDRFSGPLIERAPELPDFAYVDNDKRRFYRPQTLVDLLKLLSQYPDAGIAGGGAGVSTNPEAPANIISTEGINAIRGISGQGDHWEVGAAAPMTSIREALGETCPGFTKMLKRFGSRPLRNRATLGGYLASADPAGELTPVLMALDARILVVSLEGEREIPVGKFIEGEGETNLRPGEIIGSVLIPRFTGEVLAARGCHVRFCDGYKVAPRREMFPATVTGGFAVELDENGVISKAWLCYSGLRDLPVRARKTEEELVGQPWSEDTMIGILSQLNQEIEEPEGRDAGEREYRRQLVITLLQKFYYQHAHPDGSPEELGAVSEFLQPA